MVTHDMSQSAKHGAAAPHDPEGESNSLVQQAIRAVASHIQQNNLRVGDPLPGETHFAQKLNVSRPVMREALGALAALQLIETRNGRAPRVGAVSGAAMATSLNHAVNTAQISVLEILEVRRTIEQRTAALAASERTEAEAAEIVELANGITSSEASLDQIAQLDIGFHRAIARAAHNALYIHIVESFGPLMELAVPMAWRTRTTKGQRQVVYDNHLAIAEAILHRDPVAAAARMYVHFDSSVTNILEEAIRIKSEVDGQFD